MINHSHESSCIGDEKMSNVEGYKCTMCHREYDTSTAERFTCPVCGGQGILDVMYDYKKVKKALSHHHLAKNMDPSIWRYSALLPVETTYLEKTLQVGGTPLYASNQLASVLGIKSLYIKDDGLNPTGSLKDRASAIAVIKALELGKKTIACSSTGNAASSLAGNAARLGIDTVIFVPKRVPIGKLTQLLIYGATVIAVDGDYNDTFKLSKEAIDHYGWYNRNAAINPLLVEGKKTVVYEICEQLDFKMPDWVVVSVGDGCTIGGVYKGFYDMHRLDMIESIPKILGVQAEGCAPIYKAFHEEKPIEPAEENTLADSISVGIPRNPVKALEAVIKSHGDYITVSDGEILSSMALLGKVEGIFAEPASAAGLAGLIKAVEGNIIRKDDTCVYISTGNGLKDTKNGLLAAGHAIEMKPDINKFIKIYGKDRET